VSDHGIVIPSFARKEIEGAGEEKWK